MTMVRLFVLIIVLVGICAEARLFSLKHRQPSTGNSRHRSTSSLHGVKDSIGQRKHTQHKHALHEELENLYAHAEFLIEGVGQILIAVDNMKIEDSMLEEMDDRLVLLYKYYEDDIEELLKYLKQVTVSLFHVEAF